MKDSAQRCHTPLADRINVILRRSCFKATKAWVCGVKSAGKGSSKIIGHLIDFFKDDCFDRNTPPFLYKLRDPDDQMAYHKRRILELADGRAIKELVGTLYREEVADGGGGCVYWIVRDAVKKRNARGGKSIN
jgi:hypothetical protein